MAIGVKRVYDQRTGDEGARVLVDRVWPRGVRKEEAGFDEWLREIAPSTELRQWFAHDPARWDGFVEKYFVELESHRELVAGLVARAKKGRLTLLFGARDREHNNAVALKRYLEERLSEERSEVTAKNEAARGEKNSRSVLDFTFRKLDEAIADAGKASRRKKEGTDQGPRLKKRTEKIPAHEEDSS